MDEVIPFQPDIICLTELIDYTGIKNAPSIRSIANAPPAPFVDVFSKYAKQHNCYIICPVIRKNNGKNYNAAVLIDRNGAIAGEYYKVYPTIGEVKGGITPGPKKPPVFKTDFGKIGIQICFDLNWHDTWRELKQAGAEIIFYLSQYNGGKLLYAEAWMNKYYVVSSTRRMPARIIDISGECLYASDRHRSWVCGPINLEKAVVGRWPHVTKLNAIREKYGRSLSITIMDEDARMIIESLSPEVKVADVLKEFNIPVYDDFIAESEKVIEKYRED
jgi:predicted amidohydrolase